LHRVGQGQQQKEGQQPHGVVVLKFLFPMSPTMLPRR
jgi:hypothetical protein